jgi:hypothetical protein
MSLRDQFIGRGNLDDSSRGLLRFARNDNNQMQVKPFYSTGHLFNLSSGTGSLQLLFRRSRFFLTDPLLNRLGSTLYQVFRLLET